MFNPLQFSDIDLTSLYNSLNPSINPNPNLFFPQPMLSSESLSITHVLNPPVTHPHGLNEPDLSINGGFEENTSICDDPDEDSRIQVVEQSDPKTHDIASSSLNENPTVTTSLHAPEINIVANHITDIAPQKTVNIQSIRCEVCKVECNSSFIYERHLLGRRHKKKSEMCISLTTISSGASELPAFVNLEMKKQKLEGGNEKVIFMRFCTVCNAVYNSQEMFEQHLAGKNHANQAHKHTHDDGMESSSVGPSPIYVSGTAPEALPKDHCTGLCESDPNNTRVDQATWCEVCDIQCTCNDNLMAHKAGKKHLKAVEKLRNTFKTETVTPAPTAASVTEVQVSEPMKEDETDALKDKNVVESQTPAEDSDKKKRKVIETGADGIAPRFVSGISMMVLPENSKIDASNYSFCEVCNILCSCNGNLIQHRLGKKHLKNLVKLKVEKKPEPNLGEINEKELRDDPGMKKRKITDVNLDSVLGSSSNVLPRENQNGKYEIYQIKTNAGPFDVANPRLVFEKTAYVMPQDNNKSLCDQLARCEICDIFCTSIDNLNIHKLGKKHLKTMEKLKSRGTCSINICDAKQEESYNMKLENAENSVSLDDVLETKKQKMMDGGADGEDVRVCTVCNVMSNSQSVMDSHLVGKKHAKMMRKK